MRSSRAFAWGACLVVSAATNTRAFLIAPTQIQSHIARSRSRISSLRTMSATSSSTSAPRVCEGLRDVCDQYDAFLIDQWGVMHDGHNAYPGAVECMQQLVAKGKHVILLSNSSKRQGSSMRRLKEMGFDPQRYLGVVTSGELAYQGLMTPRTQEPYNQIKGHKVLVFGNDDDDEEYLASLGCVPAPVDQADFLLARGPFLVMQAPTAVQAPLRFDDPSRPLHTSPEFEKIATTAKQRGLPFVVANPDVIRPGGSNDPMPGLLGQRYEAMGGQVVYVGKPYPLVYTECRRLLSSLDEKKEWRVCCVGDSMMNDILGGCKESLDSLLISDGIHADALGVGQGSGQPATSEALQRFFNGFDYGPTHVAPRFRW